MDPKQATLLLTLAFWLCVHALDFKKVSAMVNQFRTYKKIVAIAKRYDFNARSQSSLSHKFSNEGADNDEPPQMVEEVKEVPVSSVQHSGGTAEVASV